MLRGEQGGAAQVRGGGGGVRDVRAGGTEGIRHGGGRRCVIRRRTDQTPLSNTVTRSCLETE
jgi:hypothetical protein